MTAATTETTGDDRAVQTQLGPLTPHLICRDSAEAIAFYVEAFGADEMSCLRGPDGRVWNACVRINGAPLMLVDEFPEMGAASPLRLNGTPVSIHIQVDDVDAWAERAAAAGIKVIMPPADMFWGDRYGLFEDPFGHRWSIATRQRRLSPAEIEAGMHAALAAARESGCGPSADASAPRT